MSLEIKINNDIKEAMIARDKVKLESLRAIKSAILLAKTAEGASKDVTDDQVIKIIQKLVKQRRESAAIYSEQNRPELSQNELSEAEAMEIYLPAQLSEEELEIKIKSIIESVGASKPSDMGKVMGVATKELSGSADGKMISAIVKRLLNN